MTCVGRRRGRKKRRQLTVICVQDDDLRKAEILSIKQRKDGLAF